MDIAAISGIMSSVKATKDIAESMIGLAQGEAMRGKVFDELAELAVGAFAYAVKESMRGLEPPHCICAACYQHAKKSILQVGETRTARGMPVKTLRCTACKAEIVTKYLQPRTPVIG